MGHPQPLAIPLKRPKSDVEEALGTGALYAFRYRMDFGASFALEGISAHIQSGVFMPDVADRLIAHLMDGGTCGVNTQDNGAHTYATCGLLPGTTPALTMSDPHALEYTLSLAVLNLAAVPTQMICHYGRVV